MFLKATNILNFLNFSQNVVLLGECQTSLKYKININDVTIRVCYLYFVRGFKAHYNIRN